ncbi:hypothetical protein T05_4206 [Trichinella murrelli]|uniref:SCAN domain-containing protein 3 n=1 Tax=Trichinella murrelli TaxID=144512 RepID=A0A0V0TB76_9BILA|nr:hypothetical protein T05_4206 [Trichinella murrelli]
MVRKFLLAFPSSHLVERGFSVVTDFLTKKRNRLQMQLLGRSASDTESLMAVRSCLRLILTKTCDLALPLKINETRLNTVCSWFENIN